MKANLTIVMYHYVRAIKKSRYPNIKGLEFCSFKQQIGYMKRFYEFVTVDDCLSHYAGGKKLPKNAALLTFDDGYSDHFLNVFPVLNELNIQGCFFPVANSAVNGKILDVNKIQLLLAAHPNHMGLLTETYKLLDICRAEGCLQQSNSSLFEELGVQS
jgi:peptidoglycan/xylan/chitin deacetylase (PgdA/CDA1 family)